MTVNVRRHQRHCARCGGGFMASRPQARYCSDNCRKRDHEDRQPRSECINCGRQLGINSHRRRTQRCQRCQHHHRRAIADARGRRIEAWWKEGLTLTEIGRRLGWSTGHVGVEMSKLRARGFDLPYRRTESAPESLRNAARRRLEMAA